MPDRNVPNRDIAKRAAPSFRALLLAELRDDSTNLLLAVSGTVLTVAMIILASHPGTILVAIGAQCLFMNCLLESIHLQDMLNHFEEESDQDSGLDVTLNFEQRQRRLDSIIRAVFVLGHALLMGGAVWLVGDKFPALLTQ